MLKATFLTQLVGCRSKGRSGSEYYTSPNQALLLQITIENTRMYSLAACGLWVTNSRRSSVGIQACCSFSFLYTQEETLNCYQGFIRTHQRPEQLLDWGDYPLRTEPDKRISVDCALRSPKLGRGNLVLVWVFARAAIALSDVLWNIQRGHASGIEILKTGLERIKVT